MNAIVAKYLVASYIANGGTNPAFRTELEAIYNFKETGKGY